MSDLKSMLGALSKAARSGFWKSTVTRDHSLFIQPQDSNDILLHEGGQDTKWGDIQFVVALVNAYRSGDLVTREELKAAVEAEREACADLVSPEGEEPSVDPSNHGDIQAHESWLTAKYLENAIRARGETNDQ